MLSCFRLFSTMQIFVRNLDGEMHCLEVGMLATIEDVINLLQSKSGCDFSEGKLLYGGRYLSRHATLADLGVHDLSTLDSSLSLLGGGKKRKKKTFTTPKKNKHKKKKDKLAILKYYKVDESGKISRLRRECESESCGAGVFMASHFDRVYCGKCSRTLNFAKEKGK